MHHLPQSPGGGGMSGFATSPTPPGEQLCGHCSCNGIGAATFHLRSFQCCSPCLPKAFGVPAMPAAHCCSRFLEPHQQPEAPARYSSHARRHSHAPGHRSRWRGEGAVCTAAATAAERHAAMGPACRPQTIRHAAALPQARPMTSNRGAGFSSSPQRSRFDPLGQAAGASAGGLASSGLLAGGRRQDASVEEQARALEKQVHALLEESAACCARGEQAMGEPTRCAARCQGPAEKQGVTAVLQRTVEAWPPGCWPPNPTLPWLQAWSARWRRAARSASCAACASRTGWRTASSRS